MVEKNQLPNNTAAYNSVSLSALIVLLLSELINGPLHCLIYSLVSPGEPLQPLSAFPERALAALHGLAP